MERVRVAEAPHVTFDRDALERARSVVTSQPRRSDGPVCTAPFHTLVVDAAGDFALCSGASARLLKRRPHDLAKAFVGNVANGLRAQLAAGALPAAHCARCIHRLGLDLAQRAPLVLEHAGDEGNDPPRLRRLVVRLDSGQPAADVVVFLRRIGRVLDTVERIDVHVDDAALDPRFVALLESLRAHPQRPALHLTVRRVSDAAAARDALGELRLAALTLDTSAALDAVLAAFRPALVDGAVPTLRFVVGPDNWFDVHTSALRCATFGVRVELHATERDGHVPLLDVPLAEQRFVIGFYGSMWESFAGDRRPPNLAPDAFDELRTELRRLVDDAARRIDDDRARNLLAGRRALEWPALDHPLLTDAAWAATLLGWLVGLDDTNGIPRWVERLVATPGFHAAAAERPWLRALAQLAAVRRPGDATFTALRALYPTDDPQRRAELLAADLAFAERAHVRSAVTHWADWLGLDRLGSRTAPWPAQAVAPSVGAGEPDVTVLIPSFRHEAFVEECIRSVVHQSHRWLVVHVVDDRSPDATVEHARAIADPRVTVRVNAQNLGLGNSVLTALEYVTTPFVALLNSDDVFHPERVARCRQVLVDDPAAQLVTTGLALLDETGGEITPANANRLTDGRLVFDWVHWYESAQPRQSDAESLFAELLQHNFLATSTNVFCRTDFLRAQAAALQSLKYCLDWHLFLEAARTGVLRHVPDRLAGYRLHRGNTVWFREGRRWSYYLEVNRVAAHALRAYVNSARTAAARERALRLAAERLARNTEADGICAFVNELLGGVELERLSERSRAARRAIESLNARAERVTRLGYATQDIGDDDLERSLRNLGRTASLEVAQLALGVVREEAESARGSARWARRALTDADDRFRRLDRLLDEHRTRERATAEQLRRMLERTDPLGERLIGEAGVAADLGRRPGEDPIDWLERIVTAWLAATRERLSQKASRIDALAAERDATALRAAEADAKVARIQARSEELTAEVARLRGQLDEIRTRMDALRENLATERSRTVELHEHLNRSRGEAADLAARLELQITAVETRTQELAANRGELAAARKKGSDLEGRLAEQRQILGALRAAEKQLRESSLDLDAERGRLAPWVAAIPISSSLPRIADEQQTGPAAAVHASRIAIEYARDDLRRSRTELERIQNSVEWRIGRFLWRKLPLFAKTRRLLRAIYRRLTEASTRTMLFIKKLLGGRKRPQLKIAAGSTAEFPIISHTFVYQELTAMHQMLGADVKVFHTQQGKPENRHAAFAYLDETREYVQPAWEVHKADFEHYRRTVPERVESLLDALAANSDVPRAQLENRFELMMAFTYARRHALWGANYVHSYFFYDQALCALVSSWVNDLPRGLSTYADHMMKDWPLKVTALHLRTADVIVATSRRIRDELISIGGPEIVDKVIVKPNGVDGTRFKFIPREPVQNRPIALVCVSRIEPKKGMIELAEAAALLKQQGRKFVIHVIGSADFGSEASERYADRFERRIAELGVGELVVRHGRMTQEKMQPLLAKADAFVAPFVETESGDKDGIPTAILEAIATGLPVIATDAGSIPEIIDDGVEGFLVPQRDPSALARAIERLIAEPGLAPRLGKAAKLRFDKEFDIRATEPRLHQRILKAVARRKPARV